MTIQELFIRSNEELKKVIDQITDEQLDLAMPAGTTTKPATLQALVNHLTYDDAWLPDVLGGKTKAEVGDTYEAILSADKADTLGIYDKYNALAIEKVRSFEDLEKMVHLSYGDFSAHDYLQHSISFRAFFSIYDIAKLIGTSTKMADDLVQGLWDEFTPVLEDYRQMGVFPPALDVADDADLQTKLFALVGRD